MGRRLVWPAAKTAGLPPVETQSRTLLGPVQELQAGISTTRGQNTRQSVLARRIREEGAGARTSSGHSSWRLWIRTSAAASSPSRILQRDTDMDGQLTTATKLKSQRTEGEGTLRREEALSRGGKRTTTHLSMCASAGGCIPSARARASSVAASRFRREPPDGGVVPSWSLGREGAGGVCCFSPRTGRSGRGKHSTYRRFFELREAVH